MVAIAASHKLKVLLSTKWGISGYFRRVIDAGHKILENRIVSFTCVDALRCKRFRSTRIVLIGNNEGQFSIIIPSVDLYLSMPLWVGALDQGS